jgi:hypothetical protein
MWLFTRYGFFSIACARKPDGTVDEQTILLRARQKGHLEKLTARFPKLAGAEIFTTPERDYRYRLVVPKSLWVDIAVELAEEQTWSNFKNEATRFQGWDSKDYIHALHEVWSVMYSTQR